MNVYCLYFPDGKRYVGAESKTGSRIASHRRSCTATKKKTLVAKAISNCGWENVKWRYLFTNCSKKDGYALEKAFIAHFRTRDSESGYNVSPGRGEGDNKVRPGKTGVQVFVDTKLLDTISSNTGITIATHLIKDAMDVLRWAVMEIRRGRTIASIGDDRNTGVFLCHTFTMAQYYKNHKQAEEKDAKIS